MIEPKTLKGFRDTMPNEAIVRNQMIRTLEGVFSSFGFNPIDTPALEYTEILRGKGSEETDKQMFRFEDNGGRDVSLRFDLTVPLARFVAQYQNELSFPFKRFHIAPVWRAEKPQKGRYREFIQCDFDIIGSTSVKADCEVLNIVSAGLKSLDVGFVIRFNNRKLLSGLLDQLNVADRTVSILRSIDKLDKIGKEGVFEELKSGAALSQKECDAIFQFISLSDPVLSGKDLSNDEIIIELEKLLNSELALEGLAEMREILSYSTSFLEEKGSLKIDLSIARGLDYYTGTVFETRFVDLPGIGSICSGGRYDNLASTYTKKVLPGVGASIGLDRLIAGLEEVGRISKKSSTAKILITQVDESVSRELSVVANKMRSAGINVELYLEQAKLGNQIKFAERKGIEFVLICGADELKRERFILKNIVSGVQDEDLSLDQVIERCR